MQHGSVRGLWAVEGDRWHAAAACRQTRRTGRRLGKVFTTTPGLGRGMALPPYAAPPLRLLTGVGGGMRVALASLLGCSPACCMVDSPASAPTYLQLGGTFGNGQAAKAEHCACLYCWAVCSRHKPCPNPGAHLASGMGRVHAGILIACHHAARTKLVGDRQRCPAAEPGVTENRSILQSTRPQLVVVPGHLV